jgi:hypothetical protein
VCGRRRRHLEIELCGPSALGIGGSEGLLGVLIEVVVPETVPHTPTDTRDKGKVREMCGVWVVCVWLWRWAVRVERQVHKQGMQREKGEGMQRRSEQARARRQARAQAQAQTLEVEW